MLNPNLPPTTPNQRKNFWVDVEALISNGFLCAPIRIDNVNLCLRNPVANDFWCAEMATKYVSTKWKYHIIARCIWMVNGVSLLEESNTAPLFVSYLESLVPSSLDTLFSFVSGLSQRYKRASDDVYTYVYEDRSRTLWHNTGKLWPCRDDLIGVPGVSRLGVNTVQSIWYSWNKQEDQRLSDEYMWQIAKNQMACHAPKGVKKLDAKDKEFTNKRNAEKQRILDTFYYKKTGRITEKQKLDTVDGVLLRSARSVADMQEEMRMWVAGEFDDHDKIVADYKLQVLRKLEQEDREKEERLRLYAQAQEEAMQNLGEKAKPLVGYTLGQIREIQKERGHNPDKPNVGHIGYASKRNYARDKWLTAQVSTGKLVEHNGRLITKEEYDKLNKSSMNLQSKVEDRSQRGK